MFHHGDCGNQDDGVGAMDADLIVLLLLPFNGLHEPIAQKLDARWVPDINILPSEASCA